MKLLAIILTSGLLSAPLFAQDDPNAKIFVPKSKEERKKEHEERKEERKKEHEERKEERKQEREERKEERKKEREERKEEHKDGKHQHP